MPNYFKTYVTCPHCGQRVSFSLVQSEIGKQRDMHCPYEKCKKPFRLTTHFGRTGDVSVQLAAQGHDLGRDINNLERELLVILHRFTNSTVLSELLDKFRQAGCEVTLGIETSVGRPKPAVSSEPPVLVENGVVKDGVFTPEDGRYLRELTNAFPCVPDPRREFP